MEQLCGLRWIPGDPRNVALPVTLEMCHSFLHGEKVEDMGVCKLPLNSAINYPHFIIE